MDRDAATGSAPAVGHATSRRRLARIAIPALAVLALYGLHVAQFWPQINDDAFITFRYSKFLATGRGPYYNVGEHVEGYSNFLMMMLMAGYIGLFGDGGVLTAAKVVGVAAGGVALLAVWGLCAAWLRRIEAVAPHAGWLGGFAAALAATNVGYALNSTTGLETTLFSAALTLGLLLIELGAVRHAWRGAGVAFGLAALIRPEGAVLFAATLLGRLLAGALRNRDGRRRLAYDTAIVALAVGGQLVFRLVCYDGELLPNTYFAKLGGMGGRAAAGAYLGGFARDYFAYILWLPALFPLTSGKLRGAVLPALVLVLVGAASILHTGADWMIGHRLLMPWVPALAALIIVGLAVVIGESRPRGSWLPTAIASGLLVGGLVIWQVPRFREDRDYCLERAEGYRQGHAALAAWLAQQAKPGETVALMDIGMIGFRNPDLNILDITGLTDRHIAKSPGGFLDKQFDPAYVLDRRPEYIVIVLAGPPAFDVWTPNPPLTAWTTIERRMITPAFREHYVRLRSAEADADPLEVLAARFGAARVFRHRTPGSSYLLFAFCYHPLDPNGET